MDCSLASSNDFLLAHLICHIPLKHHFWQYMAQVPWGCHYFLIACSKNNLHLQWSLIFIFQCFSPGTSTSFYVPPTNRNFHSQWLCARPSVYTWPSEAPFQEVFVPDSLHWVPYTSLLLHVFFHLSFFARHSLIFAFLFIFSNRFSKLFSLVFYLFDLAFLKTFRTFVQVLMLSIYRSLRRFLSSTMYAFTSFPSLCMFFYSLLFTCQYLFVGIYSSQSTRHYLLVTINRWPSTRAFLLISPYTRLSMDCGQFIDIFSLQSHAVKYSSLPIFGILPIAWFTWTPFWSFLCDAFDCSPYSLFWFCTCYFWVVLLSFLNVSLCSFSFYSYLFFLRRRLGVLTLSMLTSHFRLLTLCMLL